MANLESVAKDLQKPNQIVPGDRLRDLVSRIDIKGRFEEVLGKKAPGFIASMLALTNSNQALKTSEPMSIISAAAIAATLDLPINPNLGFAHIVPYSGVAQFQMGWKGFVQLAIRTGLYQTMNASEIYEGELIKHNRVTGETILDESKRVSDKVVAYAAYFKLTTGFEKYLVMTLDQVTKHGKRYSKSFAKQGAPWQSNFEAMALKTVIKLLLSKYGVLSIEMQKAMEFDQSVTKRPLTGIEEAIDVTYPDNPASEGEGSMSEEELKAIEAGAQK